jgi:taspase, threonine aspartase, 1
MRTSGYGSNLTVDGQVECDASIMDGRTGDFGSVGALCGEHANSFKQFHLNNINIPGTIGITGVKNPIKPAHKILEQGRRIDPLGRIPPMFVCSHELRVSDPTYDNYDLGRLYLMVLIPSQYQMA